MSTSSSAAATKRALEAASEMTPFPYGEADAAGGVAAAGTSAEEQGRRRQAEAFEQGREAGQQRARIEFETALQTDRDQVARALHEFTAERQTYYRRIESEVVQLALAIARKILHREAQLDPQTLAGIVRVTLEKLDAGTQVSLHAHPKEASEWRHYFACQLEGTPAPEVLEDPALAPGACRIETSLGSTEVGFESQLKEIETGLLDLLAERPGTK